jgi:hypothetical protein
MALERVLSAGQNCNRGLRRSRFAPQPTLAWTEETLLPLRRSAVPRHAPMRFTVDVRHGPTHFLEMPLGLSQPAARPFLLIISSKVPRLKSALRPSARDKGGDRMSE